MPRKTVTGIPARVPAEQRFEALVANHHASVWRSLRRLGVLDGDVADAAQQVFLVAHRRLSDIAEESERSFLLQTALRVAADFRRAHRRRHEQDGAALDELPHGDANPEELLDQRQARALLDRILEMMPVESREVFVLFEIEEMTAAEIATILGIPPGTVASRLRRARELFREKAQRLTTGQPGRCPTGGGS